MANHEQTLVQLKNGICGPKIFINTIIDDFQTVIDGSDVFESYDENGFSTCVPEVALRVLVVKLRDGNTYFRMVDETETMYHLAKPEFSMSKIYPDTFVGYAFTYFNKEQQVLSFYDYLSDASSKQIAREGVLARVSKLHGILTGLCLPDDAVFRFHWCGQEQKCMEVYEKEELPWACKGVFRMHDKNVGRLTRVKL